MKPGRMGAERGAVRWIVGGARADLGFGLGYCRYKVKFIIFHSCKLHFLKHFTQRPAAAEGDRKGNVAGVVRGGLGEGQVGSLGTVIETSEVSTLFRPAGVSYFRLLRPLASPFVFVIAAQAASHACPAAPSATGKCLRKEIN